MSKATRPHPATQAPKPVRCDLLQPERGREPGLLEINGSEYSYRTFTVPPASGVATCVRVTKLDDWSSYDVARHAGGRVACECADFVYRRKEETNGHCKHIAALEEFGLLAGHAESADYQRSSMACPCCNGPTIVDFAAGELVCETCTTFTALPDGLADAA